MTFYHLQKSDDSITYVGRDVGDHQQGRPTSVSSVGDLATAVKEFALRTLS